MFVMFGCYIKERKKIEKWGRSVNCEEEMREKNEMDEGGCMCVVGEKKKERQGATWVVGKKKKGNKKEKRNGGWGVGFTCMVAKKGEWKRKKKKKN